MPILGGRRRRCQPWAAHFRSSSAEPLYVQARDIWKKVLGEEHPDYARSLNNLAVLYQSMGEYGKAEPLFRAGMDLETQFATGVIAFLPEARAMALRRTLGGCDPLLSVLRKMPQPSGADAYTAVWRTRGLVSRSMAQRRKDVAQSPQAQELLAQLETTAQQLAQLTLAVTKPDQREARQKRLAELNNRKERLEAELAGLSTEFRRNQEIAAAKPEDLVRLLAQDAAVVEFYRATVWNPPPSGRGKLVLRQSSIDGFVVTAFMRSRPKLDPMNRVTTNDPTCHSKIDGTLVSEDHYDAFVLRRGDGSDGMDATWVELGPAEPIDEAVAQWRAQTLSQPDREPGPVTDRPEVLLRRAIWDKIESSRHGSRCRGRRGKSKPSENFGPVRPTRWCSAALRPARWPCVTSCPGAAALMRLFYHKLWKEQKPPITALREAQLYVYRHPEQIGRLANDRGFDFRKPAPLPEAGRRPPSPATAPTRLWAAFMLSGPGQ